MQAPIPKDEKTRLVSLKALNILDTPPEERFDRITRLALHLFNVPISTVTLIDSHREWFKSCQGLPKREGARAISFCGHALLSDGLFVIPDTKKDPRFTYNPMVSGPPFIRFYAGFPIKSADGKRVGVFCIKDRKPRKFKEEKMKLLKDLASWAELELNAHELNLAITTREQAEERVKQLNEVLHLLHKNLKHDLLNDFTVIKGYLNMYLKNNKQDLLKMIINTVDQGANFIWQMSQLETAVAQGAPLKPYSLRKIIGQISLQFPLVKIITHGHGTVMADQAIISVIENIVRNAQIHGKADRIDIIIQRLNKDIIKLCINNYGKSFPAPIKKKLFQEGFKYGASGHTGLGLYIVKRTVERYGGSVGIETLKPQGASFILKLPSAKKY